MPFIPRRSVQHNRCPQRQDNFAADWSQKGREVSVKPKSEVAGNREKEAISALFKTDHNHNAVLKSGSEEPPRLTNCGSLDRSKNPTQALQGQTSSVYPVSSDKQFPKEKPSSSVLRTKAPVISMRRTEQHQPSDTLMYKARFNPRLADR